MLNKDDEMKALVVGGGGREYANAWKIAQSPDVEVVFSAPGNAGTATLEKDGEVIGKNVDIQPEDIEGLANFAEKEGIDITVVGPEAPLVNGIVDIFNRRGLSIIGPSERAAIIEGSKIFSKDLMRNYGIPTMLPAESFNDVGSAINYIHNNWKYGELVVKGDGLAGGKAVLVSDKKQEAYLAAIAEMVEREFGKAGERILIEPRAYGRELSRIGITDGRTWIPFPDVQDYKPSGEVVETRGGITIYEGNRGKNTGGLGGLLCPLGELVPVEQSNYIDENIMKKTIQAMEKEGRHYKGALYGGLILTQEGPKVLEFNARFGDPEDQLQKFMMKSDIVPYFLAISDGKLDQLPPIEWKSGYCVGVVVFSLGYPDKYEKGKLITGLDAIKELRPYVEVFHAGTKMVDGYPRTSGGRVACIVGHGETREEAKERAYQGVELFRFDGMGYRKDIGEILEARKLRA